VVHRLPSMREAPGSIPAPKKKRPKKKKFKLQLQLLDQKVGNNTRKGPTVMP
jgi:hypothetical protein